MTFAIGEQHWRDLLFLHWEVPLGAVRALVPPELQIETFEGRAYVGVTPFRIEGARARLLPPLPGLSDFLEVNVRTYVRHPDDTPGVWFFSLDASNLPAVLAARTAWQLPYYLCEAEQTHDGAETLFRSERQRPGLVPAPTPARCEVRYRRAGTLATAQPGSIEHYFVERYSLYTQWRPAGLMVGQVSHQSYAIQPAELLHLDCESLVRSVGIVPATGNVHALYSPGVDVEVLAPRPVRQSHGT